MDRVMWAYQARQSRRLTPGHQAILALVLLRNTDTYSLLAAGFEVGTATA